MRLQAPSRGQDEDYVHCLLYVNGNVWCGSSDGTINVFNPQVSYFSRDIFWVGLIIN